MDATRLIVNRRREGGGKAGFGQERARDDRFGILAREARGELACGVAAGGRERPQVVGLARGGLGVADEEQTHGLRLLGWP